MSNVTKKDIFIIAFLILTGCAIYFIVQWRNQTPDKPQNQETAEKFEIDVEAALSERILGDPDAPVKVTELSSFTCSHCGRFHKKTFPAFKKAYIDQGRAYLVFTDFPLNAPALHASMIARCLPHERYFDFVQMLFETQSEWAYDAAYLGKLQAKARKYGLSEAYFEACLNSDALQQGIIERQRAAGRQWDINSTPSFVINNKEVITGVLPPHHFAESVERAAQKTGGGSTPR